VKEESSCTSSMSVCGQCRAREEQGADGASMKALLSSRKPRSGSSNSLATPLLAAAQIICKWQPRGSEEEDAVTVEEVAMVTIMMTAVMVMVLAMVLEMIMLVADGRMTVSNKSRGRTFFVTF